MTQAQEGTRRGRGPLVAGHAKIALCHIIHPNHQVYQENLREFFESRNISLRNVAFDHQVADKSSLLEALNPDTAGIIGLNWELDHTWIGNENFIDIVKGKGIPLIEWILDHPSSVWPRLTRTRASNSRFVFLSPYSEAYFRRYILPDCRSASVVGTGVNYRSRVANLTRDAFLKREIRCLLPINMRRIGGTLNDVQARLAALPQHLQTAVKDAISFAQYDLDRPIESHFFGGEPPSELLEDPSLLHLCIQIIEEVVQIRRRLAVFRTASQYPILIQSDISENDLPRPRAAELHRNVSMAETIDRMRRSTGVLSLTHVNDELHNRTLNGLNAGAVNVVEDNAAHRPFFRHGENALLFRYDDDSLRESLDIVCFQPERAYRIATAGFALRDDPRLRFGGYDNFIRLLN